MIKDKGIDHIGQNNDDLEKSTSLDQKKRWDDQQAEE